MSYGSITIPKTDYHILSQFSQCTKDVTIDRDVHEAQLKGISRIAITDHGSVKKPEWICGYFREIERCRKRSKLDVLTGMECDIGSDGSPAVSETILGDMDIVIGAIHELPKFASTSLDAMDRYLKIISSALEKRWMRMLAHPTDVGWIKLQLPSEVSEEISCIASKNSITLELNFHHRDPTPTNLHFLQNGVSITPTSDAHELNEIGIYDWHESMLKKSGFRGEIRWMEL